MQDQHNEVATIVIALACALLGTVVWKYADPIGAIADRLGIFLHNGAIFREWEDRFGYDMLHKHTTFTART